MVNLKIMNNERTASFVVEKKNVTEKKSDSLQQGSLDAKTTVTDQLYVMLTGMKN